MIIGLGFRKFSGKDEVGKILTKEFNSTRLAFADHLKSVAGLMFGFSHEQLHGNLKDIVDPAWGFTPSHALQKLGTEVGRTLHPDVWRRYVQRHLQNAHASGINVHVTDVRFANEAAMIRECGGFVVEVRASVHVREQRALALGIDLAEFRKRYTHASETELAGFKFDAVIDNDLGAGTADVEHGRADVDRDRAELRERVRRVVHELYERQTGWKAVRS